MIEITHVSGLSQYKSKINKCQAINTDSGTRSNSLETTLSPLYLF